MKIGSRRCTELPRRRRGRSGRTTCLLAVLILGAALLPTSGMAAAQPAVVIRMTDKPPVFIPAKVTITAGQTIRWINDAKTLHSVDADPVMAQRKSDVALPQGAKPFDSGFMQPEVTFDHTFTVRGTYKYTCVPHEKDGMNGVIIVK
jgi:plastocyanin